MMSVIRVCDASVWYERKTCEASSVSFVLDTVAWYCRLCLWQGINHAKHPSPLVPIFCHWQPLATQQKPVYDD